MASTLSNVRRVRTRTKQVLSQAFAGPSERAARGAWSQHGTILQLSLSNCAQVATPLLRYADLGEHMAIHMTRSRLIGTWYAAVALVVVAAFALGAAVRVSTGAMLLALAMVPPVLVIMLWPDVQPLTASEVIHGTNRRT